MRPIFALALAFSVVAQMGCNDTHPSKTSTTRVITSTSPAASPKQASGFTNVETNDANASAFFSADELARANTAANATYMSEQERRFIFLSNLARLDGARFTKAYLDGYIKTSVEYKESSQFVRSLRTDLAKTKGLTMLQPLPALAQSSKAHASELGKAGKTGHSSLNGEGFDKRIGRFLPQYRELSENETFGFNRSDALHCLMAYLVDEGLPDAGHRKTCLDKNLTHTGVSILTHTKYQFGCVVDYAQL